MQKTDCIVSNRCDFLSIWPIWFKHEIAQSLHLLMGIIQNCYSWLIPGFLMHSHMSCANTHRFSSAVARVVVVIRLAVKPVSPHRSAWRGFNQSSVTFHPWPSAPWEQQQTHHNERAAFQRHAHLWFHGEQVDKIMHRNQGQRWNCSEKMWNVLSWSCLFFSFSECDVFTCLQLLCYIISDSIV